MGIVDAKRDDLMERFEAKCVLETRAVVGEGPCWRKDRLWWVDIEGSKIHCFDPDSGEDIEFATPAHVGLVVPTESDAMIVALANGFHRFEPASGEFHFINHPEADRPENRFNDGKCDLAGRLWAGTTAYDERPGGGSLYALEPDGVVRRVIEGVTISNGIAWSLDQTKMYYIDTPTRKVMEYDFDSVCGTIDNPRTAFEVPRACGFPDGMAIDADGMLWIAMWGGSSVIRWNPGTEEQLARVDLPVSQVTSCCFGGPDLETLYITSAARGISAEDEPLAGSLFAVEPPERGLPTAVFRG